MDAAAAAFQVDHEDPSRFSREYGRLFGASPLRDVTNLRQTVAGEMGRRGWHGGSTDGRVEQGAIPNKTGRHTAP